MISYQNMNESAARQTDPKPFIPWPVTNKLKARTFLVVFLSFMCIQYICLLYVVYLFGITNFCHCTRLLDAMTYLCDFLFHFYQKAVVILWAVVKTDIQTNMCSKKYYVSPMFKQDMATQRPIGRRLNGWTSGTSSKWLDNVRDVLSNPPSTC